MRKKEEKIRKIISVLLCLCLLVSLAGLSAAEEAAASGGGPAVGDPADGDDSGTGNRIYRYRRHPGAVPPGCGGLVRRPVTAKKQGDR